MSQDRKKTRMAGSEEFKAKLDRAGGNKAARERIANSPERTAARLEGLDRDKYDFTGYSDKDIVMAFQGGKFADEDYARLTGKPLDKDPESPMPELPDPIAPPEDDPKDPMPTLPDPEMDVPPAYPGRPPVEVPPGFGPGRPPVGPGVPGVPGLGGGFFVGGDLNQTIGKQGDMNTTIGSGNVFGAGTMIGNDNSMTVGSQNAGNTTFGAALDDERQLAAQAGAFGRGLRFS